jgi:predicted ATPase/class 3 adenylate cyclase
VLFCDLVGSTELSARLDPEEMREVIGVYQANVAEVVQRWDGHLAKYMGDGVLVYFGWPQAHEDDAERAVRAGLELVQTVAALRPAAHSPLKARVGIATGHVVVGDLGGQETPDKDAVVGETPNLAARLQSLAEPGSVAISQATRRLVSGVFELDELGPQRLKGFAEPLAVWRVSGQSKAEGRFEARHTAGLTPLVGRAEELSLLLRRWEQVKDGEGQVVLLSGEPGIGKSRLVREVRARLEGEPHLRLSYQCSPHHTTSPLHPVIEQLERAAGFEPDDLPENKLDKLKALLARGTDRLDEAVPLIAALLDIPIGDRYALPELTPQRQKQLTLEALTDQLEGLAKGQPVLLVYEDLHWIDPTSQELLGLAIAPIQRSPVLAIISFRPDFVLPWPAQPHVSAVPLTRLGRRDGATLVKRMVGAKALPDEVSSQIVGKTDGVPLFVEELTKTVLESGLLQDAGDRYELSGPLPPLAIPSTLHDSLLGRLDRLAHVKEVAQIGAAIGREFSHELLAAVADRPENELRGALDQLVSSELVFRRGTPPEATYSFKHALVQEAAYDTLLKSRRQLLHARIALILEERFPKAAQNQPELLARHYAEAGLIENAIIYWHKAGLLAVRRSAMGEAITQLRRGIELLPLVPDGHKRALHEIDLQVTRGLALLALKGVAAPEMGEAYTRARELCREVGYTSQLLPSLRGLFMFHLNRAELCAAHKVAEELLLSANAHQDCVEEVIAHRCAGACKLFSGALASAVGHFNRALVLYTPTQRYAEVLHDPRVLSISQTAWAVLLQGYPDDALARSRESLAAAHAGADAHTLAMTMHQQNVVDQLRGDWQTVKKRASALMTFTAERGFAHWHATATILHGWAVAAGGAVKEGVVEMNRGLMEKQATGAQLKVPYYLGLLAAAYASMSQESKALRLLDDAAARVRRTKEQWFKAELHRLRGEVLLRSPKDHRTQAEACFDKALSVAQQQDARLWELRSATSLARLWGDQGRRHEALDLLAPVCGWFTEGFDTADLKEARALLDGLR